MVSAVVSLTLTPMMCGRLLRPLEEEKKPLLLARLFEASFRRTTNGYRRTPEMGALAAQPLVLLIAVGTLAGTDRCCTCRGAEGLPAGPGHRRDRRGDGGAAKASPSPPWPSCRPASADEVERDPAVSSVVSFVGAGSINPTPNAGRPDHHAEAATAARRRWRRCIARLQRMSGDIPGLAVFMQPVQDIQIGTRISRTQYQYTLVDTDAAELATWAPRLLGRLQPDPGAAQRRQRPAGRGAGHARNRVDREAAQRLGVSMQAIQDVLYDSFGQRQISTIFSQANQYRVVLEADPSWQADPASLLRLRVPGVLSGAKGRARPAAPPSPGPPNH